MSLNSGEVIRTPFVWHPVNSSEAVKLRASLGPDAAYISGGTLLRTQWEADTAKMPSNLINVSRLPGASGVQLCPNGILIGAFTTLSEIRRNPEIGRLYPALQEAARQIAAPSIRNVATLGGNVASAIGDAIPALLVLDCVTEWDDGFRTEALPLTDWLEELDMYRGRAERLLLRLELPLPDESSETKPISLFHKVGRREVFTPSVATTALSMKMDESGLLSDVRIAAGGGQTIAHRLYDAEAVLEGRMVELALIPLLHEAVMSGFQPVGDVFSGETYRKQTAANLIAANLWHLIASL